VAQGLESFRCPACGTGTVREARVPYTVKFRGSEYEVEDAEVMLCSDCEEIYFAPGQSDALQRRAADKAREDMGLLTGHEIAAFRRTQGLTQAELEGALGVPPKTVARWEIGTVLQSRCPDTFLRLLMRHSELIDELFGYRVGARFEERDSCWGMLAEEMVEDNAESEEFALAS